MTSVLDACLYLGPLLYAEFNRAQKLADQDDEGEDEDEEDGGAEDKKGKGKKGSGGKKPAKVWATG